MRKFTIRQLIKAAQKNGYPWAHGSVSHYEKDVYSCVIGQGWINLGVEGDFPYPPIESQKSFREAWMRTIVYNDREATSYEDAYAYMVKKLTPFADEVIVVSK